MVTWKRGNIEGVQVKKLVKHLDGRGFLCEAMRLDEMPEELQPAMSYISYTEPGVSRGPHEHRKQSDYFVFLGPGNFLVKMWDNRPESNTYGNWMELYAGCDNPISVAVPPGIIHGYLNLSRTERGMVINYPNRLYQGWNRKEEVDEIRHENDPDTPFRMEEDNLK